ncbi:flagellar motor switch protein FliM [Sphingomonas sp. ID0503]|uniref:flagellar motor switch protein FliM n=1 Tax=Sphingomonas sp. ID0503 TaxID=3399691 RepID=UPI003AFA898E
MTDALLRDAPGVAFAEPDDSVLGAGPRARHAEVLGSGKLSTLGDLHSLQQLCDRQAKLMRDVFEPLLRRQPRVVAEPLRVESFGNYVACLPQGLISLNLLRMAPLTGNALVVMDAGFVLSVVDLFFGGSGAVPNALPPEFTGAEEAIAKRAVSEIADMLTRSWVELAEVSFAPFARESNVKMLSHLDADDSVVITRFELTTAGGQMTHVDIVYPVMALKPLAPVLGAKVQSKRGGGDPKWKHELTRAVMQVPLSVRTVLAEPVVPLSMLMDLKPGDIIPIEFGQEIPIIVSNNRFATGTVGQANGRTALRLERLETVKDEE